MREAQGFAERSDVFFDESGIEAIVTGGYRSVGGEDDFAGDSGNGGLEREAFIFHAHADGFQHGKGTVAFIKVKNAGRDSKGFQGTQASDTEQ